MRGALFLLATLACASVAQEELDQTALVEYTRELLETLKKQVEWAKFTTDQLGTMMGPRIGTHMTELAGYCATGVSVVTQPNITSTDCLYECLSADECAGFNFYSTPDRPGVTRCEMVTTNIFSVVTVQPDCTMFLRRWRNNQFGTLFSGSRIASPVMRTDTAPTMSDCVGLCKKDDRCMHISYRQPDQTCTMHATGGGATIEDFSWLSYGRVVRCPDFYIRFQRSCYRSIKTSNETWTSAQASCRADGTGLVNIHSIEENQFIRELILREAPNLNWWIGASENNGEWLWSDVNEPDAQLTFQFWTDSPRNADNAKCAFFDVKKLKWNRAECEGTTENDKYYYICETAATQLEHPVIASKR